MAISLSITGEEEAFAVAARLRRAGDGRLQGKLRDAVRDANRGVPTKLRMSALSHLPKRGGLGPTVARGMKVRTWPISAGITIKASHRYDIAGMDKGLVVHPLFGNKRHWYAQAVPPGWFQSVVDGQRDDTRRAIERVVATFVV